MSPIRLYHAHYAEAGSTANVGPPVVLLHGFLGNGGNWHSVARRLSARHTVYVPDARNHGKSPHSDTHAYADMAADVLALLDRHAIARAAVVGHSMGGKVAMHLALTHPERVDRLALLDIAPGASPGDAATVLAALAAVDIEGASDRAAVEADLGARIGSVALRGWLMKNLVRLPGGGFRWALNVPVLLAAQEAVSGGIEAGLPPIWRPYAGPVLVARGERSDYVPDDAMDDVHRLFPAADLVTIADAGHWLHADNPDALVAALDTFLDE